MPLVRVSNGGTTPQYRSFKLSNGASSASITLKEGDVVVFTMLQAKWAYKKNGGAQKSYNVAYSNYMTTYGDFMYLVGHNYAASFQCLSEGNYVLVNNSGYERTYAVPDR